MLHLAQIGFILIGIGWGTAFSLSAALLFTFNHALIKAAMLMHAGVMAGDRDSAAPAAILEATHLSGIEIVDALQIVPVNTYSSVVAETRATSLNLSPGCTAYNWTQLS